MGHAVDIWERLGDLVTERVRKANIILRAGADGAPMPAEPFHAVRDCTANNGQRRA